MKDFITDNNPVSLNFVVSKVDVPEYVEKELPLEGLEKLASHKFADVSNKLFPIDTPSNIWKSYTYLVGTPELKKSAKFESIRDAVLLAGCAKNITYDLRTIDSIFEQSTTKEASEDTGEEDFALILEDEQGDLTGYYPIDTPYNIKKSSFAAANDSYKLPEEVLWDISKRIVKAAKEQSVDISELSEKMSRYGNSYTVNFEFAEKVAAQRAWYAKDEESKELYQELVKTAKEDKSSIEELVEGWCILDRKNGIKYSHNILSPIQAFFSGYDEEDLEKEASQYVAVEDSLVPFDVIKNFEVTKCEGKIKQASYYKLKTALEAEDAIQLTSNIEELDETTKEVFLRELIS